MLLRSIPSAFAPPALAEIDRRLAEIVATQNVHIPLAVESGSRAWGFASPDSDYDCRFVFARPLRAHLTPFPRRDVIETPLIDLIDLNGWDFAKAINLMLKGNAVIFEWLRSPIVYQGNADFRAALLDFGDRFGDRKLIARHYLHTGESKLHEHFAAGNIAPLKKQFYAIRPAAVLRYLRLHPGARVPPMNFQELMAACDPPEDFARAVDDLLIQKQSTRELGGGVMPGVVRAFLETEFAQARTVFAGRGEVDTAMAKDAADGLYREWVEKLG